MIDGDHEFEQHVVRRNDLLLEQLSRIKQLIARLNVDGVGKLKKAGGSLEEYVLAEKKAGRLTEEADALVRLNALYLMRRVEQDPGILKRK